MPNRGHNLPNSALSNHFKQIDEVEGGLNLTIGQKSMRKRKDNNALRFDDSQVERISISPPPDKGIRYTSKLNRVLFKKSVKGENLYPESASLAKVAESEI